MKIEDLNEKDIIAINNQLLKMVNDKVLERDCWRNVSIILATMWVFTIILLIMGE